MKRAIDPLSEVAITYYETLVLPIKQLFLLEISITFSWSIKWTCIDHSYFISLCVFYFKF